MDATTKRVVFILLFMLFVSPMLQVYVGYPGLITSPYGVDSVNLGPCGKEALPTPAGPTPYCRGEKRWIR